jgi:hypothetical protein
LQGRRTGGIAGAAVPYDGQEGPWLQMVGRKNHIHIILSRLCDFAYT